MISSGILEESRALPFDHMLSIVLFLSRILYFSFSEFLVSHHYLVYKGFSEEIAHEDPDGPIAQTHLDKGCKTY